VVLATNPAAARRLSARTALCNLKNRIELLQILREDQKARWRGLAGLENYASRLGIGGGTNPQLKSLEKA
jgi:hypothetical protein